MKTVSLAALVDCCKNINISRQALDKRFCKEAVSFLKKLLTILFDKCLIREKSCLKYLKEFSQVLIIDSSLWQLHEKLKDVFPGFGGASSKAGCKLQLVYNLLINQIHSITVTEGTKNDSVYSEELLDMIKQKALLLFDLGYFSIRFFQKIHEKGAYFISRLKGDVKIFNSKTREQIDILKFLKKLKQADTNKFEINILLGVNQGVSIPCRLIGMKAPKSVADKRRMQYKKRNRRVKTVKQITLQLYDWTLMITNTPHNLLPTWIVYICYELRWQIEIIFKQFKSILQIHKINSGSEHRVKCEIYGKLIAAVIITKIHGKLNVWFWNKEKKEISLEKFFKTIQTRAFMFMTLLQENFKKAIKFLEDEVLRCLRNCVKLIQRSRRTSLENLQLSSKERFRSIKPCQIPSLS